MAEALVFVDPAGGISSYNQALCRLTGYNQAELLGQPFTALFSDTRAIRQVLLAAMGGSTREALALTCRSREQRDIPVLLSTMVVRHAGQVVSVSCQLADARQSDVAGAQADALAREHRLAEVTRAISSELDISQILQIVLRVSVELVGADMGGLARLVPDGSALAFEYTQNLPAYLAGLQTPRGVGMVWQVIESGNPTLFSNYPAQSYALPELVRLGVHSVLAVPITVGIERYGAIGLYLVEPERRFTRHDLTLVETVAQQAGIAIRNAQLFEAAQRRAEEAETLRLASAAVAATLNLEESIDRILEQLALVVPYDSASVQLLREHELEIVGGHGFPDLAAVMGLRFAINGHNPAHEVYQQQAPVRLGNAPAQYPIFRVAPHNHIHSWLGVPLIIRGTMIGMLAIDSTELHHFTANHARLAAAFADQVAIALENARLFAEAHQLATTDPLTGLYNRRHFFTLAQRAIEHARRYSRPLCAVMLDIDHFKYINDSYGHSTGDTVIQRVAEWCRQNLRETDVIGRYGGEEFVILLVETALNEAYQIAERLREEIAHTAITTPVAAITMTISLGVAAYDSDSPAIDGLLNQADEALYAAKAAGRNQVMLWQAPLTASGGARLSRARARGRAARL